MRIPFSEQQPDDIEFVATSAARITCDECGEWIYTIRHVTGVPAFFPLACAVCGAGARKVGPRDV